MVLGGEPGPEDVHEQDVGQVRDNGVGAGPRFGQFRREHLHDRVEFAAACGRGAGYMQERRQKR